MKRNFINRNLASTVFPAWHCGLDNCSAINEAHNVKKGNRVVCEACFVHRCHQDMDECHIFPSEWHCWNHDSTFSLRSFFGTLMNTYQNGDFSNFKKLAPLDSRNTQNFSCMSLYIILEYTVLNPATSPLHGEDILTINPVFHSMGPLKKIW